MVQAIRSDKVPNLLILQYSQHWTVSNLVLVPSFFFTEAAIEKRKPLGPTARRAGWVGCNILLASIAPGGKIYLVTNGVAANPERVREQYKKIKPVARLGVAPRGWALNVLNFVHRIGKRRFTLADIYAFDNELGAIFPNNRNVRPKIRQQLQVLRDVGQIEFLGKGQYKLL
jgi:type II restriction enzyme